MKKLLIIIALISVVGCSKNLEQRKLRKEKAIVLGSMATMVIQMKVIADKQKVIK